MSEESAGNRVAARPGGTWWRDRAGSLVALVSPFALVACGERVNVGGPLGSDAGGLSQNVDSAAVRQPDAATRDVPLACCGAGESYGPSTLVACDGCCTGLLSVSSGTDVKCELPNRKVLVVMPVSGSLVITDPAKMRVELVSDLIQRFEADTTGPMTQIAVVAYSSSLVAITQGFTATPDLAAIDTALSQADDLEDDDGALNVAFEVLSTDMLALTAEERAQTSYVVVFFADILPQPLCSAIVSSCGSQSCQPGSHCVPTTAVVDGGTQEDYLCQDDYLVCTVPKSDWATAFNPPVPSSLYPGLVAGLSYNTTPQLVADVSHIMQLKALDHVGALSVSTVFLLAQGALSNPLASPFDLDEPAPEALLQALAQAGSGSFQIVSSDADLSLSGTPSLE